MPRGSLSDHGVGVGKYRKNSIIDPANIDTTANIGNIASSLTFGSTINAVTSIIDKSRTNTNNLEAYVGCNDGTLARVNVKTGSIIWTVNLGSSVFALDVWWNGSSNILIILAGDKVYSINPSTGAITTTSSSLGNTDYRYLGVFNSGKVVVYNPASSGNTAKILNTDLSLNRTLNIQTLMVNAGYTSYPSMHYNQFCFDRNRGYFMCTGHFWDNSQYSIQSASCDETGNYWTHSMGTSSYVYLYDNLGRPALLFGSYRQNYNMISYSALSSTTTTWVVNSPTKFKPSSGQTICLDGSKIRPNYELSSDSNTLPNGHKIINYSVNLTANTPAVDIVDSTNNIWTYANGSTLYYTSYFGYKILG